MIRLAVLDPTLQEQLRANPIDAKEFDVLWAGTDFSRLLYEAPLLRLDVLVAHIDRFPEGVARGLRALREAFPSEELVVLYNFVRRAELEQLMEAGVRVVRSPVSLRALKTQLLGVLVKKIFSADASSKSASQPMASMNSNTPLPSVPPRRYTEAQLARLQDLQSGMQCECPNHVAQLVLSLRSYEDYAANCTNRDERDAAVHRQLYEQTARARVLMEEALALLIEHEKIRV